MQSSDYAHLHLHTDASFQDGYGRVDRTMSHARSLGFNSIGMTDHGNLTNTISFIESANEYGMKAIIGMEGYVSVDNERFHITLLANGNEGFSNLVNLNNIGVEKYGNSRPTFEIGDFKNHNKGIYLLTGCPSSPMQMESYSDSVGNFKYLKKLFGNRMFVEMMLINYGTPYHRAIQLSENFNTPIIVTNDVHFAKKEDAQSHIALQMMKTNNSYNSEHLFMATPQELIERLTIEFERPDLLPYLMKGMRNAGKLASVLQTPEFDSTPKLPVIVNADKKLWKLIEQGYQNRLKSGEIEDSQVYRDRYLDEFKVIRSMGFCTYFLIVHDICNYSYKQNIWIGTRGSGAGCLILYLLGSTSVDPIKYDLYFERFLNYKRQDRPDVDLDIDSERRDQLLDYVKEKYDAKPIANYSTYKHKSLLLDLKKKFDFPEKLVVEASEYGEESKQFRFMMDSNSEFADIYNGMVGQLRHLGKHAGGVVIGASDIDLPLIHTSGDDAVVSWTEGTYRELTKIGVDKFDILGLTGGALIRRLQEKLNTKATSPDDPKQSLEVFEMFQRGDTAGVHQFKTDLNRQLLRSIKPSKFSELVAINALCRPGTPQEARENFAHYKATNTRRYLHPDIDDILSETFGAIVFQEQFMKIIAFVMDGEMADADLARKVLTKASPDNPEWVKKFNTLKQQFYDGATNKGWKKRDIANVWSEIELHSGYSFNKSHAVAYTLNAWEMAWFKCHHKVDFFTESLNVEKDSPKTVEILLMNAVLEGIEIRFPDINKSTNEFTCDSDSNVIYLPLTSIKYVSDTSYNKLVTKRPFKSVEHYMKTVPKSYVKSRGREGFLSLGVFDSILNEETEDELIDLLEVKSVELGNSVSRQQKYLGFVIPTKNFIEAFEEGKEQGITVGVVDKTEMRSNSWGKYQVCWLKPEGVFTHKFNKVFEKGDVVGVKYKKQGSVNIEGYYEVDY